MCASLRILCQSFVSASDILSVRSGRHGVPASDTKTDFLFGRITSVLRQIRNLRKIWGMSSVLCTFRTFLCEAAFGSRHLAWEEENADVLDQNSLRGNPKEPTQSLNSAQFFEPEAATWSSSTILRRTRNPLVKYFGLCFESGQIHFLLSSLRVLECSNVWLCVGPQSKHNKICNICDPPREFASRSSHHNHVASVHQGTLSVHSFSLEIFVGIGWHFLSPYQCRM